MVDILGRLKSYCFTYETPRVVQIESKFIGAFHKVVQLAIFIIVLIWIFILNSGYQHIDKLFVSTTTAKLKGIAHSNTEDVRVGKRIWDPQDLQVSPQDNGAFFLTTNVIVTKEQALSVCTDVEYATKCTQDSDCLASGMPYHLGHGISTGICNLTTKYCKVEAWCPVENDSLPENGKFAILNHTQDFTVFIKNHVRFPFYNKKRTNLIESVTKKYLRGCKYHPDTDPYCPIFRLGTIVGMAGMQTTIPNQEKDDKYFAATAIKGGVISFAVSWDCNFDRADSECKPKYSFTRLDDSNPQASSVGYNFRYARHFLDNGVEKRMLVKSFGILFILRTEATARAFDLNTCLLNIGSSLALIGFAKVLSEILLLNIHKHRGYYTKQKIAKVTKEIRDKEVDPSADNQNQLKRMSQSVFSQMHK